MFYLFPVASTDEPMPQVCEYKGVSYVEGQKFTDGCKNCICKTGFNGMLYLSCKCIKTVCLY